MTRPWRIAVIVAAAAAALLVLILIGIWITLHTLWFHNFVRQKVVSSVEESTGGRASVGPMQFNWGHLQVTLHDFVIHGLEPVNAPPLLQAREIQVSLRPASPGNGWVGISSLVVDTPRINLIVYADGKTNIPSPETPSRQNGLKKIVDLAVGHFEVRNGAFTVADVKSNFNASGDNLRAQLSYDSMHPGYSGVLDVAPLRFQLDKRPRLDVTVNLPVKIESNSIAVQNANLRTPHSNLVVSGDVANLAAPRGKVHLTGYVGLADLPSVATLPPNMQLRGAPNAIQTNVTATITPGHIEIQGARLDLGKSNLTASGDLRNLLRFNLTVALGELGRTLRLAMQPQGTLEMGGNLTMGNGNYRVVANVIGRDLSFREGTTRLAGIALASSLTAVPNRIALGGLRLTMMGGSFAGSADIRNMQLFSVNGKSQGFRIEPLTRMFLHRQLGYAGTISGALQATGNFKRLADVDVRASLTIAALRAPGEIPVSGRVDLAYNGAADTVLLNRSYVLLPHSRLDVSGALNRQITVRLTTRSFADFSPVAQVPIALAANGSAVMNATVTGRLSAPHIGGQVTMTNFAVEGRPFTSLAANVAAAPSGVTLTNATLTRGTLQAQFSASVGLLDWKTEPYEPLRVDATVRNADIRDLLAIAGHPGLPVTGDLAADAHVTGTLGSPQGSADLTVVNGSIAGERFDQASAQVSMTNRAIDLSTLQLTAGAARVEASGSYVHPVNDLTHGVMTAQVRSTDIQLAQLRQMSGAASSLSGMVSLNGSGSAELSPGPAGERFDIRSLNANLSARQLAMNGQKLGDVTATAASSGTAIVYNVDSNFAGSTTRVSGQTAVAGDHATTAQAVVSNLPVGRVLAVAGHGDIPVSGTAALNAQVAVAFPNSQVTIRSINGSLRLTGLQANGKPLGELAASATTSGTQMNFRLASNVAQANVRASGTMQLAGAYPVAANVSFTNVTYEGLQPLLGGEPLPVQAELDGSARISGSMMQPAALQGAIDVTNLVVNAAAPAVAGKTRTTFALRNAGNIEVALDRGVLTVRNFRLTGTGTSLTVTGTAAVTGTGALNLRAAGNVQLGILQAFDPDIYSSGQVTLDAAVTGTMAQPAVNGRVQLANASLNVGTLPVGIANANGTIGFSGNEAVARNITAESGGGRVTLSGFVRYGGPQMRVEVQATANGVHVEYPQNITTEFNARLTLAGTTQSSLLSGTVTVTDMALRARADVGSILTSLTTGPTTPTPVAASGPSTGFLGGIRFDVRIQTSPGAQFRTSVTQNLQADANLTLLGTVDQPGMLGRVAVTEGNVVFFGNKYTIDEGSITFTNPHRINPQVNLSLQTTVTGVNVVIGVTGPMDRLKLTYRSDPPLQFQDIVSLLAAGKTPTTDPVLAAHEPVSPQQSYAQAGASAILGQAVANPITGRLQRLFGVTRLSINPQIVGGTTNYAQTGLTVQQQVSPDLTFTYMQDPAAPNPEIIRVDWNITPTWSAMAERDEYGLFDLVFYFRKRFH